MKYLSTDAPAMVLENLSSFVSACIPHKLKNGLVKSVDYRKPSPSTISVDHAISNGVVAKKGKSTVTVLDGAIEKRLYPVEFEWTGPGDKVLITGSFYDWTVKIPLNKKSEKFYARIDLPKGRHEFKFIVNGVWKSSLRYPTATNSFGDVNNCVEV